jgi:zinc protease
MRQTAANPLLKLVLAVFVLSGCSKVDEVTLANGLRVIVKEDHRSPVVVSQIWYKIGSQDEPPGLTGISHVLEHMMFKGTHKLKPNEFSRIIAENGGRENAFTSYDYTAYFQQLEKSRLAVSFELEADRMQNLLLDPKEFAREIKVVMEERRLRTEDQPEALVYEKFMHTAYQTHSYRNPVIGWMADLKTMKAEDLRAWYQRWYAPNNAILVVVGDVRPKEVFAAAEKYFGPAPARPTEPVMTASEPAQPAERRTRVSAPAEVPHLLMGYHVPVLARARSAQPDWEPYALSVLTGILDGGDSARFQKELVRQHRIASEVDTGYSMMARSPTMLSFSGTPAEGHSVKDLEQALRDQLARLKNELVSEEEMRRVKAQVVAADVYGRDSVFNQAMQLGQLAANGLDIRLADQYVERINAVTPKQVQEVARKYLTDENLTVAVLDPLPLGPGKRRATRQGGANHVR